MGRCIRIYRERRADSVYGIDGRGDDGHDKAWGEDRHDLYTYKLCVFGRPTHRWTASPIWKRGFHLRANFCGDFHACGWSTCCFCEGEAGRLARVLAHDIISFMPSWLLLLHCIYVLAAFWPLFFCIFTGMAYRARRRHRIRNPIHSANILYGIDRPFSPNRHLESAKYLRAAILSSLSAFPRYEILGVCKGRTLRRNIPA